MCKVVYSAIFNNYDSIKDPIRIDPDWRYIMFTDDPTLKSDYWEIVVIPQEYKVKNIQRIIKIFPESFFAKLNIQPIECVWVDGSTTLIELPSYFTKDSDFTFKIHPERDCIYEEAKHCIKLEKDIPETINKQVEYYKQCGYEENKGLVETGLFHYRVNPLTEEVRRLWLEHVLKFSHRDQISLPFVLSKFNLNIQTFDIEYFYKGAFISKHIKQVQLPSISYHIPYAIDGNLGKAYNEACEQSNAEWICLMDGDMMFLDNNYGRQLADIINKYPDTGCFGPLTNRLSATFQLYNNNRSEDPDIANHRKIALHQYQNFYDDCYEVTSPLAGLMMVFKKDVWKKNSFKNGLVAIDTDFGWRLIDKKLPLRVMKGLYVFHYYRLLEGAKTISHLLGNEPNIIHKLNIDTIHDMEDVKKLIKLMDLSLTTKQLSVVDKDIRKMFLQ